MSHCNKYKGVSCLQVMHFVAMTKSRTRTQLRSVPQMWTTMAVTRPAPWITPQWRVVALCTTRRDGGSTSAAWQTWTAAPKMQTQTNSRGRKSFGTPGDRTESPTPLNLWQWRSGGLPPITEHRERETHWELKCCIFVYPNLYLIKIMTGIVVTVITKHCWKMSSATLLMGLHPVCWEYGAQHHHLLYFWWYPFNMFLLKWLT